MRHEIQKASFQLDKVNQCAWLGSEQICLSPKAFSVLLYLAERPGRLVTKQELLDTLWPDTFVTEGVLKRAVLEIRKALGDSAEEPRFIQTRHRRGYLFLTPGGLAPSSETCPPAPPESPAPEAAIERGWCHHHFGSGEPHRIRPVRRFRPSPRRSHRLKYLIRL